MIDRFAWQLQCVQLTEGRVLNVGAKEDPAHLKDTFGDRVVNCDISDTDFDVGGPIEIDVLFDATKPWPFEDDHAEMVIYCEMMEHLTPPEAVAMLSEARRCAQKLCLTIPCDENLPPWSLEMEVPPCPREHLIGWTEEHVCMALAEAGWQIERWERGDGTNRFCILAKR